MRADYLDANIDKPLDDKSRAIFKTLFDPNINMKLILQKNILLRIVKKCISISMKD